MKMKRRNALKTITLGAGYTMTLGGMATFISSCKQEGTMTDDLKAWAPSFMDKPQAALVENILDAMLPKTEMSPGYKEVGAIQILDNTINKLWGSEDQNRFKKGIGQLTKVFGGNIGDVSAEKIQGFLKDYMSPRTEEQKKEVDRIWNGDVATMSAEDQDKHYLYRMVGSLRDLGIGTYFASETIATEYLAYDPIPGAWVGCTDLAPDQKTWSL